MPYIATRTHYITVAIHISAASEWRSCDCSERAHRTTLARTFESALSAPLLVYARTAK